MTKRFVISLTVGMSPNFNTFTTWKTKIFVSISGARLQEWVAPSVLSIVYASGYIPITKMIKSGFIIDLIGIFVVTIPVVMVLVKAVMGL